MDAIIEALSSGTEICVTYLSSQLINIICPDANAKMAAMTELATVFGSAVPSTFKVPALLTYKYCAS